MRKEDKQFEQFKKWFTYYQNMFGLNGYKVYFKYEDRGDCFASLITNQEDMVATVYLNSDMTEDAKPFFNVRESAKHEALHLLLARYSDVAHYRYTTKTDIYETEEELVRRLETLIPNIKVKA